MPSGVVKTQKQWEALLRFMARHRIYYNVETGECSCLDEDKWHRAIYIEALAAVGRLTYKLVAVRCRHGICGQLTIFDQYSVLTTVDIAVRK
ncbi:MAG: hypothetical protein J7K15_10360 [Deltaproteobacteria bacterium]|nr:hypothetical protein [Deltaproteobacteria bacterium]